MRFESWVFNAKVCQDIQAKTITPKLWYQGTLALFQSPECLQSFGGTEETQP